MVKKENSFFQVTAFELKSEGIENSQIYLAVDVITVPRGIKLGKVPMPLGISHEKQSIFMRP